MTRKNRPLVWAYVNHAKKEYLSGNYLIAGHHSPADFTTVTENMSKDSALGATLVALITPLCKRATGAPVRLDDKHVSFHVRGRWFGDGIEAMNNKQDSKAFRRIESSYRSISVECMYYMQISAKGWSVPLYETNKEFWHLPKPTTGQSEIN